MLPLARLSFARERALLLRLVRTCVVVAWHDAVVTVTDADRRRRVPLAQSHPHVVPHWDVAANGDLSLRT